MAHHVIQPQLLDDGPSKRVINVASVKHLSPFRYPGGKTWFVPHARRWVAGLPKRPKEFIEAFAGGASVGLSVLYEGLADHLTLVELDGDISAVWKIIFSSDAPALAERILSFKLSLEAVTEVLSSKPASLESRAFQTILRNRVNRGGILAPGAGLIKEGENGRGLQSRWYPETLKRRILSLASLRDRVSVIEGNGIGELERRRNDPGLAAFIDPPYTAGGKKAGSRLYNHWQIDHERLFKVASELSGSFVMTYESDNQVLGYAARYGFESQAVAMKSTHHEIMSELVIGRDLSWLT